MATQPIVLFVDDDENLRQSLAQTLHQPPYQLLCTRSAEEAIWTLKTRPVDLIVADDRMPGMSGSDLLVWVAEHYPDVVRIMLTGQATAESTLRAINEDGVYHFFTKPCDVVQLAIAIRKALEHKQLLGENRRLAQQNVLQKDLGRDLLADLERLERLLAGVADGWPHGPLGAENVLVETTLSAVEAQGIAAGLVQRCRQAVSTTASQVKAPASCR